MMNDAEARFRWVTIAYLLACLLLGGASAAGIFANLLLQLAALPLIWWSIARLRDGELTPLVRQALWLLGAILLLPLLQLIPLPPSIWSYLPGRQEIVSTFAAMGVPLPWAPISMAAHLTWDSWLALLPATALFLAVLTVSSDDRLKLTMAFVAVAMISILMGAMQVAGGAGSALYPYRITNVGSAVGFFANRNHFATELLMTIPCAALIFRSAGAIELRQPAVLGRRLAVAALLLLIIVGVLFTGSRAGLALLFPTILLTYAATLRSQRGIAPLRVIAGVVVVAVVAIGGLLYGPFYQRIVERTANLEEDVRFWSAPFTWAASMASAPFGTGFGTFDPVFRRFAGNANLGPNYVNHAHNDYLELWMTGGAAAAILLLVALVWCTRLGIINWRLKPGNPSALARMAVVMVAVVIVHSIVDYPLRTAAISALFAMAVAFQLPVVTPRRSALDTGYRRRPIEAPARAVPRERELLPHQIGR